MIRISLKDLLARKLRLALTSLAVVMGVAMVSGTYVLTDTLNAAFVSIFQTAYSTSDAVITGKAAFGSSMNAPSFPAATLAQVRALPAVAAAGLKLRAVMLKRKLPERSATSALMSETSGTSERSIT